MHWHLKRLTRSKLQISKNLYVMTYQIDPIHLFGLYAKNIQSFRFLAGEKSSLLAAVSYVKSEECGHFMMPNEYEVPKNDITETTIGLMFGRKFCNTSAPSGVVEVDEHHVVESEKVNYTELLEESEPDESLKSTLIEKLNNIVDSSRISRDMITVSNDGRRTVAHVECILCQEQNTRKLICVQYDLAKNSSKAYWNISNFKKHINGHISKKSGGENIVNLNSVESKQEKSLNLNVDDLKTTKSPVRLPKNSNTLKNLVKLSDQSRSNSPENNNGDLLGQQQSR